MLLDAPVYASPPRPLKVHIVTSIIFRHATTVKTCLAVDQGNLSRGAQVFVIASLALPRDGNRAKSAPVGFALHTHHTRLSPAVPTFRLLFYFQYGKDKAASNLFTPLPCFLQRPILRRKRRYPCATKSYNMKRTVHPCARHSVSGCRA